MMAPIRPDCATAYHCQRSGLAVGKGAKPKNGALLLTVGFLTGPVNVFILLRAMSLGLPPESALLSDRALLQAVLGQDPMGVLSPADEAVLHLLMDTCKHAADELESAAGKGKAEDWGTQAQQYLEQRIKMWHAQGRPLTLPELLRDRLLHHLIAPASSGGPQGKGSARAMEAKMQFLANMALRLARTSLGQLPPVSPWKCALMYLGLPWASCHR